ncbi:MFS transporter [Georgenia yuyongxinii]|uniref:MFS transporter n=1 Tax=Georgenia yuyongxinii TaxID=2589797 RepID=A0A552WT22_9MICO|nr:MFS transporter [Georgenia yuyongxinii]TRW45887.1 MFS transporter [Georgenia yuyongxinii]
MSQPGARPDTRPDARPESLPRFAWGCAAVVVAGLNLRPAIVAVAPVVGRIERNLGVDAFTLGLLTALPLTCFALFSPFVQGMARRWGAERLITVSLATLGVASLARIIPTLWTLLAATLVVGLAIAVGNVLVPAIIKKWFPQRLGTAMGLYSVSLFAGAALAGSLTVPLADALPGGWNASLASWGTLALVACLVWVPFARRSTRLPRQVGHAGEVWRQPLAWWVTAYMGLQSFHYFTVAAWLPEILAAAGHPAATAGLVLGTCNVVAMAAALVVPVVASRMRTQRGVGVALAGTAMAGLAALLVAPAWPYAAAVLLGVGQGGAIALALLLVVLRSASPTQAAVLSGMSQSAGYLVAAAGAPLAGAMRDATGSWTLPVVMLVALLGLQAVAAARAGVPHRLATTPAAPGPTQPTVVEHVQHVEHKGAP